MTVSSETWRLEYAGNGVTTAFTTPQFLANADIKAYLVDDSDGSSTTWALTTNFTLTGAGSATGTLTALVAPATDFTLVIVSDPAITQAVDYVENDPFPAASHEGALDKLTLIVRRLAGRITRSLQLADSDTSGVSTTLPVPAALEVFRWNSDGTAVETFAPGDVELAVPADESVTLAKHADFTPYTVLGRASGTGVPSLIPFTAQAITLASRTTPAEVRSDLQLGSAATKTMAEVCPTGALWMFAMTSAPSGWLECDGAAVSRTTYAALFSAIGEVWGAGNGTTTFNLPDMRGEFARGWDHGRGVDSGRAFGSAQSDELEAHVHATIADEASGAIAVPVPYDGTNKFTQRKGNITDTSIYALSATATAPTVGESSSTGGTETRPRNKAVMYCIKT